MYVCLNGSLVGGKVGWPEFAHLAARTGYPGTEVDLDKAMEEGLDSTRALLKTLKLRPGVVDFPVEFSKDDAAFRKDFQRLEKPAQFAAALGCPRMLTWIMPSSDTPKAELRKIYLDRFRAGAEVLAKYKVRLGLEFIGPLHLRKMYRHEFIWRMDEMVAFAEEIGPNVGLLLDAWHWHHAGATTRDIQEAGAARIVHVHVADAPNVPPEKVNDAHRLMPGEGVIDLVGFFKALREAGYKDGVSPEPIGRLKNVAPEDGARLGLQTTLLVMKKAGAA